MMPLGGGGFTNAWRGIQSLSGRVWFLLTLVSGGSADAPSSTPPTGCAEGGCRSRRRDEQRSLGAQSTTPFRSDTRS